MRIGACLAVAMAVTAAELPGIPGPGEGPGPGAGRGVRLIWGNDALGPGLGGASDDFRTNRLGLVGWWGGWFAAIDHSILTANYPGGPVEWGMPDPFARARVGSGRRDELLLVAGHAWQGGDAGWTWSAQVGPGVRVAGDLGGRALQEAAHGAVGASDEGLAYQRAGAEATALIHAGAGARRAVAGPVAVRADAVGLADADGRWRLRAEAALAVAGSGTGLWLGLRRDLIGGEAGTVVERSVDQHEDAAGLVAGWWWSGDGWTAGLETGRAISGGSQFGSLGLAWTPDEGQPATTAQPWRTRLGLLRSDGRHVARGLALAVAVPLGEGRVGAEALIGVSDQEVSSGYAWDAGQWRQQLWIGAGLRPWLAGSDRCRLHGVVEGGVGWQRTTVESRGLLTIDDRGRLTTDLPLLRLAAGIEGVLAGPSRELSLGVLADAQLVPRRDAVVTTIDPLLLVPSERFPLAISGPAVGILVQLGATVRW